MLDITLNDHVSRLALVSCFVQKCEQLLPRDSMRIVCGFNQVTVYKDEEYDQVFDVFHSQNGKIIEENDSLGIHFDELEELIIRLLFFERSISQPIKG